MKHSCYEVAYMQRDVHVFGADTGVTMPTDVDCRIGSML